MPTARLFYDDEYDALAQMVASSGKSFKELAAFLFPDMKPESAYAKLKNCVNSKGDERLKFGQIIAAMNFCGQYDPLYHACDETFHARPELKAAEEEEVRLATVIQGAAVELQRAMQQLERVQGRKSTRK
jgi:hypothetical protein